MGYDVFPSPSLPPSGSTEVAADCTWHEVGAAGLPQLGTAQGEQESDLGEHHANVPAGRPIQGFRVVLLPPVREEKEEEEPQQQQQQHSMRHLKGQPPPRNPDELGAGRGDTAAREALMPIPCGQEGEVCVEGVGVAAGYLHGEEEGEQEGDEDGVQSANCPSVSLRRAFGRAARDAQRRRFVRMRLPATCSDGGAGGLTGASASLGDAPANLDDNPVSLLFRTGDLGIMLPSGELFFGAGREVAGTYLLPQPP